MVSFLFFAAQGTGTLPSSASERLTHADDYTIENWQVEQGLPQVSVISIAQTPDGYLWLGTFNGLVRFDGVRFAVFGEVDTPALGSSGILRLLTDRQGGLWILTLGGGLTRLAAGQFEAYGPERGLPACGAVALAVDSEGRPLVVDRDGGVHRIEGGQLVEPDRSETGNVEPRLLVTPSEWCWVEREGKAANSARAPLRLPTTAGSDPPWVELAACCGARRREGGFWLASTSAVYRFERGRLEGTAAPLPETAWSPLAMAEDSRGNLWVGSWGQGVFRRDPSGQWQQFTASAGLAENDVTAIFVDREDNVWVGTGSGGLYRFKPRLIRTYDRRDGLGGNNVMSVTEDRQGRLWIGMNGGGVNCWQDGRPVPLPAAQQLRGYRLVYSVLADRDDGVWFGTYGGRALRLYQDTVTAFDSAEGFLQATPWALLQDSAGSVWLGCDRGLQRYDAGRFTLYTREDGLAPGEVRDLAEDRSGTVYIGTRGGGLHCYRGDRFIRYTKHDGLPDNRIAALWVDHDDTLWIGTVDGGLSRFRQGRFATVNSHDGLPSNNVGTLLEDDTGHLWLGSSRGLVRLSLRELNGYLDHRQRTLTYRVFNQSDGLNGIDCSGGGQPACWKARDGRLWFATVKGLAVVDPRQLPLNPLPPQVIIEEAILVDSSAVVYQWSEPGGPPTTVSDQGHGPRATARPLSTPRSPEMGNGSAENLLVPPGKHRLEFRFTGLSLVAPEKVRFRYRLTGLDADWIEAGSQRTVSYSHLPPGTYRFEVTACNNDGVWNETGAVLGLAVLPPWWMTWWFRTLLVITVAGLVLGWYERRLYRLRHDRLAQEGFSRRLIALQETERQRIAGELHDGMGQDLLVIASEAQLSLCQDQNPPATAARLQDIAETAKHALQQARRMAHNLRPGLLDELGLTKAIQATLGKAARASGLSIVVNLGEVDGLLTPEFEVSLYRIAQETLSNVLKHAAASEAKVTLTRDANGLRLTVEDNGRGFDPGLLESVPPDQRGFGLHQIAERAKMMGGRVDLHSRPGEGTRLTVQVPLRGSPSPASAGNVARPPANVDTEPGQRDNLIARPGAIMPPPSSHAPKPPQHRSDRR